MKIKELFHRWREKIKSIGNAINEIPFAKIFKRQWQTGKIQRSSRITYDIIWNIILFFLIVSFIGMFFIGGIGFGYFASLVKDEPLRSQAEMENDIYNYAETSKLYFADDIYIGDIRSDLLREETTLDKVSPMLLQAVTATEDEYFKEHHGVVPKAIFRALFQEITNASMQSGGSTLTQQLIKNQVLTNEVSFERKAKEILLALRLEQFLDKDQILEAYLNIVPYGRNASGDNIAGVQTAAQGIFGINANEVNLAQAAYLAGLPQSPSYYTPFENTGGLKDKEGLQPGLDRMKVVLNRMLDMGHITEKEYKEAIDYDIVADFIEPTPKPLDQYPYLVRELQIEAKELIKEMLIEKEGYTLEEVKADDELNLEFEELAGQALENNGYRIHSTIDKEIYDTFQEVAKNFKQYGPDTVTTLKNSEGQTYTVQQSVQAAAILIDNKTGRIISFLGGREFSEEDQTNYVKALRSNGSTMKPLLVYAPALEKGIIQPGTPIADIPTTFSGGYSPNNFDLRYHGILSARDNLKDSFNIPAVKLYTKVMNDNPVEQYLEKMGITSLGENEYQNASLALGGTSVGISLEENTNAFTTFANAGKFNDAYMIEKITTVDGEVVYEHKPEPVEVFSPQTSYLMVDMMRDVISNGSATYLNSQLRYSGVDWAGKTGTSQNVENVHFVASNPNVTMGSWLGYEYPDSLRCDSCEIYHSNRNMKLWAELINAATAINPELLAPQENFAQPEGIVSRSYCQISGMLPSDLCADAGLVKTDIFNAKFVPTQTDNSLVRAQQILIDGRALPPGANAPDEFVRGNGLMFNPEWFKNQGYDRLSDPTQLYPNKEREKWERIAFPGASRQATIEDDGKAPAAPELTVSGSNLTWNMPAKDVVGYRVYRADSPDGNFTLIESTTSTSFQAGNGYASYRVRAVDFTGKESNPSNPVTVGKAPEKEPPKEEKEEPAKEPAEEKEENENENNNDAASESNENNNESEPEQDTPEEENDSNTEEENSENE
ncbi:penicillin-binding protein [Oceanobacillus piezotolerans]|uniref:Penicillin-binding protein n=1 Tax=Oceanobacillus piezotolerans TaxID=2448030 RepID=A0A498DCP3_9BACI|nr:transglycosylase domain-containing protein [Oceanobacillus piezotolerans]RLL47816.1 penicillin-binding protein [Oceanobacillus piezotolerans]